MRKLSTEKDCSYCGLHTASGTALISPSESFTARRAVVFTAERDRRMATVIFRKENSWNPVSSSVLAFGVVQQLARRKIDGRSSGGFGPMPVASLCERDYLRLTNPP
jgi:hypothetical protein